MESIIGVYRGSGHREEAGVGEFRLEVREFQDLTRWRWALTGAGGALIADHEVRLDRGCWQYEAFGDLLGYLSWHAAPDQRAQDEARIVAGLGAWIGTDVLGPVAGKLAAARQATVRVVVPEEARWLLFRPLELAHAGGRSREAPLDVDPVHEPSRIRSVPPGAVVIEPREPSAHLRECHIASIRETLGGAEQARLDPGHGGGIARDNRTQAGQCHLSGDSPAELAGALPRRGLTGAVFHDHGQFGPNTDQNCP